MKFAVSAPTRKAQMEQSRRDRTTAPVLRAAFPSVQHLRIDLRFQGPGSSAPTPQTHLLYPPARAFFEYRCPYSDCDGQFDLNGAKLLLQGLLYSTCLVPWATGLEAALPAATHLRSHRDLSAAELTQN